MAAIKNQKSHYLLPLNSMIFKSKSSMNLPYTSKHNIFTKSSATVGHIPVEDDDLTALPPAPGPAKPLRRQPKTQDLTASSLRSQSSSDLEGLTERALRQSRSMTDLEEEGKKQSVWRRFIRALKKPFRKEKGPVIKKKAFLISSPTDFHHVGTGIACLPGHNPSGNHDTDFQHLKTGTACLPGQKAAESHDTEGDNGDWETVRVSQSFT